MSKAREYPSAQPFNVAARKNLTKNRNGLVSWWSKSPFHNNSTQSSKTK